MRRFAPAFIAALTAIGTFGGGTATMHAQPGHVAKAPATKNAPTERNTKTNVTDRVMQAIGRGRSRYGRVPNSINGRPDTGVARIKRAARKRRNQLRARRAG